MNNQYPNQPNKSKTRPLQSSWLQANRDKITDAPFTFGRYLLSPIIFLFLLFWLTIGKIMLGFGGWLTIFYLLFLAPVLLVISLLFYLWLRNNYNEKITCLLGKAGHALIPGLYLSLFLQGFFMLDAGDVGPGGSVATNLFGDSVYRLSDKLSTIFIFISIMIIIMIFSSIIVFTIKRKIKMSQNKIQ